MRVPIPRERLQGPQEPRATAPNVVPMRDYTGQQTQELGQSVERAGLMTSAVGARLRERHDAAASKSGVAAYQDGVRKDLETPESGYLRRIGKDAVDGRQSTIEAIEKRRRAVRESLENDDQRAIFDAQTEGITQRALSYIDDHYVKQSTAWDIGESEAIIGSESGAYASNWPDPAAAAESRVVIIDQTNHIADLQGLPKDSEQRKAAVLQATTGMHLGALDRMIADGKTADAKRYLEQHGDEIDPRARDKAVRVIESQTEHDEATLAGLDAVKLGAVDGLADLDRQFREGGKSAKWLGIAEGVLASRERSRQAAQSQTRAELMTEAIRWADSNRVAAQQDPTALRGIDEMPTALRENLMENGLYAQAEQYMQRGRWSTTPEGDSLLQDTIANPKGVVGLSWPALAANMRPLLDDRDMGVLGKVWADANQQPDPVKPKYLTANGEFATELANQLGVGRASYANPAKPTQDELDRTSFTLTQIDLAVADIAVAEGREPTRKDYLDYVLKQKERQALDKSGVAKPLATFSRQELEAGPAAVYRDPKDGQETVATFAEVRAHRGAILASIAAVRDAARESGLTDDVRRLDKILAEQPLLEMAQELAKMRKQASDARMVREAQERDAADAREAAAMSEIDNGGATRYSVDGVMSLRRWSGPLEQAWSDYSAATGRRPWNHRTIEDNARASWMSSETRRRASAARFPGDPRYSFEVWHGLEKPKTPPPRVPLAPR